MNAVDEGLWTTVVEDQTSFYFLANETTPFIKATAVVVGRIAVEARVWCFVLEQEGDESGVCTATQAPV